MMRAIRGFIFDLDGVLVDTARFHYLAWRRLAREEFNFDLIYCSPEKRPKTCGDKL